jgi:hypothetical protein
MAYARFFEHVHISLEECVMKTKTLARMAVFTVLIGGVSVANARADDTSVYVAGKAKYCKETAVSGYLDCFYASLDACEKRTKSTNLRCVANPNSGT